MPPFLQDNFWDRKAVSSFLQNAPPVKVGLPIRRHCFSISKMIQNKITASRIRNWKMICVEKSCWRWMPMKLQRNFIDALISKKIELP